VDTYELAVELDFLRSAERPNGNRPIAPFEPEDMRLYAFIFVRAN